MLSFHLEKDGKKVHAYCPQLPGCHTFGKNNKEALVNLQNAMDLYIQDAMEDQTFGDIVKNKQRTHVKV